MKSLQQHISEKLIITKNYMKYNYNPKTPDELKEIIKKRYDDLGPGTNDEPIDFNDIGVSQITSFFDTKNQVGIFEKTKFEYIDVSSWDVSNVINMNSTFRSCQFLKELDLSNWNVSNVTNMGGMFTECKILKKLDLSTWNVSNVEDMYSMFRDCSSLKEINLSNWNVSNVEDMFLIFDGCKREILPDWYKIENN